MTLPIQEKMTILFQGDSITDCGRLSSFLDSMGSGYAYFVASQMSALYPEKQITFLNRGISGDCVDDLASRWRRDCLSLAPDLLSILVGVNDTWQYCTYGNGRDASHFKKIYQRILSQVKEQCNATLVLCEPFLLHVAPDVIAYQSELDKRIEAVQELAHEFDALYIPFHAHFSKNCSPVDSAYWAPDGVHPTPAGHALMANLWMEKVFGIRAGE